MRSAGTLVLLAGCLSTPDRPTSSVCTQFGEWSPSVALVGVNSADDDVDPWLSLDRLDLYFARTGPNAVFHAHRASEASAWGMPEMLFQPDDAVGYARPSLTGDQLAMYYTRNAGPGSIEIALATRTDRTATFGPGTPLMLVPGVPRTFDPSIDDDDGTLMFAAGDTQAEHLYIAIRSDNTTFLPPVAQPELDLQNGGTSEAPSLGNRGGLLLFQNDGGSHHRIYQANLHDATSFDPPTPWPPTMAGDTSFADQTPFIDRTGTLAMFSSDRVGGAGAFDLYETTRTCLAH